MRVRRSWLIGISAAIIPLLIIVAVYVVARGTFGTKEIAVPPRPEAPPDLEKLRGSFLAGLDALQRGNGPDAVKHFAAFDFKQRPVEEYRLYFLAGAYQAAGDQRLARVTLAKLWERAPRLVYWQDVGLNLANKYGSAGDWLRAAEICDQVTERTDLSAVAGIARWQALNAWLVDGEIDSALRATRELIIKSPRAPKSADAIAMLRSMTAVPSNAPIALNAAERLQRAVSLLRDGDPQNALEELNALEPAGVPADLRTPIELNRGLALHQLRRFEDSNRVLDPLAGGRYIVAIPALYHAAKNYRILSDSINPIVNKTIIVRQQVGTTRVHVKGKKKPLLRPKFANVKKTIQLIDLAKKAKKEEYDRLATERLKDLLRLPLADEVRIEVLNTLIAAAEAKHQDAYEQELVTELARLDPSQEAGLQHLWDKAWLEYTSGDLNDAQALFTFVHDTYRNPNVKRQAEYWRARTIERLGKKEEAAAIYRNIAGAAYEDLYALHSESHGAAHQDPPENPLKMKRADWEELAERNMPSELRLAYELTALSDARDARLEIQKNLKRSNQPYADALLADLYNSSGDDLLMMRSLRRAFPEIATVEQDSVPAYFLRMYYPLKYTDAIVKFSKQNGLDPYLMMGLIHQESFYNPRARSPVGATGLMQLMPSTARELARALHSSSNAENPEVNIRLGTFYFRQLTNMFGGAAPLAVASYNAGQGNVLRWRRGAPHKPMDEFIESIPFPETRNYVKRVTMLRAAYRRLTK